LIFGSFDPGAPPLNVYLGTMALFLDTLVDRNVGGTELIGGVQKWRVKANWKIPEDNNSGDEYHVPYNHGSYLRDAGVAPADFLKDVIHASTPEHHNFSMRFELPNGAPELPFPILSSALRDPWVTEYLRSIGAEAERRLGRTLSRVQMFAGTVFPNFSLVPLFSSIRVVHPRGPDEVEIWSWCIVDRDAPQPVKNSLLKAYMELLGPSGLVEQDDSEIWEACTVSSRISAMQDRPYNYQMGLGKDTWHEDLGCTISDRMSETAQRGFYSHWTRLMEKE
jgi:3-phenylpropionate/trans-cinnamate dioxygenase alpha subunit